MMEIPDLLPYPDLYNVHDNFNLFNKMYCYIIDKYNINDGYNLYIGFRDEYQLVKLSDFKGNNIDLRCCSEVENIILSYVHKLSDFMKLSKIVELGFYFSNEENPILVDVMVSINKMLSPGMLRDLFANIVPTQNVLSIEIIDENILNRNQIIIKPSKFKYIFDDRSFTPLYGIIS